jgi:hypothetical protein
VVRLESRAARAAIRLENRTMERGDARDVRLDERPYLAHDGG